MLIFTDSSLAPLNKSTRTPLKAAQKTPPPILTRNLGPAGDAPGFNARRTKDVRNPTRPAVDATIKLGKHILLHGVFSGVFVDRYGPFSSFSGRAAPAPIARAR